MQYFDRGHCKRKDCCRYSHSRDICKLYLENRKCDRGNCQERHPKVCKFWMKNKAGCKRGTLCAFLHFNLAPKYQNTTDNNKDETKECKCVVCETYKTDKTFVVEHMIQNPFTSV